MSDQGLKSFCPSLTDAEILELGREDRFHVDGVVGKDAEFAHLFKSERVSILVESLLAEPEVCRVPECFEGVAEHAIAEERLLLQSYWLFAAVGFGVRFSLQVDVIGVCKPDDASPDGKWKKYG